MAMQETMTQFDLNVEIERFPPDVPSGRRSETLIKTPRLRVVLITMRAGAQLHEHIAPGTITVQPIRGRFTFTAGDDEREIVAGTLVSVEVGDAAGIVDVAAGGICPRRRDTHRSRPAWAMATVDGAEPRAHAVRGLVS